MVYDTYISVEHGDLFHRIKNTWWYMWLLQLTYLNKWEMAWIKKEYSCFTCTTLSVGWQFVLFAEEEISCLTVVTWWFISKNNEKLDYCYCHYQLMIVIIPDAEFVWIKGISLQALLLLFVYNLSYSQKGNYHGKQTLGTLLMHCCVKIAEPFSLIQRSLFIFPRPHNSLYLSQ